MKSLALCLLASVPVFCGVDEFNGRWNIKPANEPRGRAWWLEVKDAGSKNISGSFVGAPGGQLDTVPKISIEGNELVWVFERNWRGDVIKRKGVYRAKIVNGALTGYHEIEGIAGSRVTFTGKRAPALRDKDDGSWKKGRAVELFNGRDLGGWSSAVAGRGVEWRVENGLMKNNDKAADIVSAQRFWNFQLHIEFRVAQHSNSGVGLRGRYEIQIFGDHGEAPSQHGNGALYSRITPAVNATLAPDQWQVYDITLVGRELTVVLNGKTLIDHKEVAGLTAMATDPNEDQPGPLTLQGDHGPVEFRKITVTPLVR
ncbi:MAG: DUF1080 domain-containing protein [Bryobacteraceae bacterium]